MERKKVVGKLAAAAFTGLVGATAVEAQTPKQAPQAEEQLYTSGDIERLVISEGLYAVFKRADSQPRFISPVISYLNSRASFSLSDVSNIDLYFFPKLVKHADNIPSAVPFLRTYIHSVVGSEYISGDMSLQFGNLLATLYRVDARAYSALALELLGSRVSDDDVSRALFSTYPLPLTFLDLDAATRKALMPELRRRFETIQSTAVLEEYKKEETERRSSHLFANMLSDRERLKVLQATTKALDGDQLHSLSSDIIASAHRWATTPLLQKHLVRIGSLNPFDVFSNIASLKQIRGVDVLAMIKTASAHDQYQDSPMRYFSKYADVPGAENALVALLATHKNSVDLAYVGPFIEMYAAAQPIMVSRVRALFPQLDEQLTFETGLTAQNQRTDLARMRADPTLALAYRIPYAIVRRLVQDATFDKKAWTKRLRRYDTHGWLDIHRSTAQLKALQALYGEHAVNPVELAHARLSVARNLLMNALEPTRENIERMIDEMLRTRVVRDAIPMRGATLLVTNSQLLDYDPPSGNPKGSPAFGTSAQVAALKARSTSFEHVKGVESNAVSLVLQKLVAAPTDFRFIFLGHGGETNSDVALYLSDGNALPGGKAEEGPSTVKITARAFAAALLERYRRSGIDPTRDTFYFSGCQFKGFVDIIRDVLSKQGITPPNMAAAAEHGQSNFIYHDGIYGPHMDEAYILSNTWGEFRRNATSVGFRSKPPVFSPSILPAPGGRVRFLQIGANDVGVIATSVG